MPIGFWMLVAAIAATALLWSYNAWPEWKLYRIGRSLGITHDALIKTPRAVRITVVRARIGQQLIQLCWRTRKLAREIYISPDSDGVDLDQYMDYVSRQVPSLRLCDAIQERFNAITHDVEAAEAFEDYTALEDSLGELREALKQLPRIEKRLTSKPAR